MARTSQGGKRTTGLTLASLTEERKHQPNPAYRSICFRPGNRRLTLPSSAQVKCSRVQTHSCIVSFPEGSLPAGTVLKVVHLAASNPPATLDTGGEHPHFIDVETEAQNGSETCLDSTSNEQLSQGVNEVYENLEPSLSLPYRIPPPYSALRCYLTLPADSSSH